MPTASVLRTAIAGVMAAAGLLWMNSLAALQLPSVLLYSGMVVLICGILSVLVPPAWLGFRRRYQGMLAGVVIGAALFAAGWLWPSRMSTVATPATRLDAFMPAYHFHERHELVMQAPPERVRAALNSVSFDDIGVMQTLGKIRAVAMRRSVPASGSGVPPSMPIVQMIRQPRSGFFLLDDTSKELVFGLAGQPWNNRGVRLTPEEFRGWAPSGNVKIAANFRIEDLGMGRSRVVTETRVAASDDASRRKMGKYWALIYPGSGMIRRSLLRAIQDRAERP